MIYDTKYLYIKKELYVQNWLTVAWNKANQIPVFSF